MNARSPRNYPWSIPVQSGVLGAPGFVAGARERHIDARGSFSERIPVMAVGSNAAPAVLGDKLRHVLRRHGSTEVPIDVCSVVGLSVGHSAHVSLGGYVAATPFLTTAPSKASAYSLAWLTPDQLTALDATEPSYDRVLVPAGVQMTSQRPLVEGVYVYRSRHGLLGEDGDALSLRSQDSVFEWLQERLPVLAGRSALEQYADPEVREEIRAGLVRGQWVVPSGLS